MKLKTIFWIAAVLMLLQLLPLLGAMISPDVKAALILDAFGVETLSPDGDLMFDTFALVLGCVALGIFFMMVGITSIEDLAALKRLSFLLFVVMGFSLYQTLSTHLLGNQQHHCQSFCLT